MISLLKNIFGDISVLYKNFLHFNLSKIVIYIVSILYAMILSIPFLIILGGIYFYLISTEGLYSIFNNVFILIPGIIIALIVFFTIIIAFSYNYILLTKLNLEYTKGKKLSLGKNYYFNFKLFWTFYKTMFLNFLIIVLPFIVGIILITILIVLFGGINDVQKLSNSGMNAFTVSSLIIAVLSVICFIYFMYKTLFVFIILVDESKGIKFKKAIYYIKKSFKLTNGFKTFFRFIVVGFIVLFLSLPLVMPLNYYIDYNTQVSDFINYNNNPEYFDLKDSKTFYYLEDLKVKFEGRDLNSLVNELNKNSKIRLVLEILNFLFIYGLFEMMLVSFYKRQILKENKSIELENTKSEIKKESKTKTVKKTTKKKVETKVKTKNKKAPTKKVEKKDEQPKKKVIKKTTTKKTEEKPVKRGRGRPRKTEK